MNVKFRENVFDVIIHSGRADVETGLQYSPRSSPKLPALIEDPVMNRR